MIDLKRFLQNGQYKGSELPQKDLRDTALPAGKFYRAVLTIAVAFFIIYRDTVLHGCDLERIIGSALLLLTNSYIKGSEETYAG